MSNEREQQTLISNLKGVQERYRRQSLESRLEDVAEDLRDIKLQVAIMEEMFDTEVGIDQELVQEVKQARKYVKEDEYDSLEEEVDTLEQKANSAQNSIEQALSKQLVSYENRVNAMVRINKKVNAYNQDSLEGLRSLLDEWNWREAASIEDVSDFQTQLEESRSFGSDMKEIYDNARSKIIEPLADEGIKGTVESILGPESVHLTDLSQDEREKLVESDLGDYLAITFG